jgi:hypothetical protein
MKEWFRRHAILTREERLLIGGILLILLCGLVVRHVMRTTAKDAPAETIQAPADEVSLD